MRIKNIHHSFGSDFMKNCGEYFWDFLQMVSCGGFKKCFYCLSKCKFPGITFYVIQNFNRKSYNITSLSKHLLGSLSFFSLKQKFPQIYSYVKMVLNYNWIHKILRPAVTSTFNHKPTVVKVSKCDYLKLMSVGGVRGALKNFIQIVFNWVWKLRLVKLIEDDGKAFKFYHFLRGFFFFAFRSVLKWVST